MVKEGAESSVDLGDPTSEVYLTEIPGSAPLQRRDLVVESDYEYGSRVGVWRILDLFGEHHVPLTVFAVGKALEDNPAVGKAFVDAGHEVASHAYRWHISCPNVQTAEDVLREKGTIKQCIDAIRVTCGQPPRGWYFGRFGPKALDLLQEVYKEEGLTLKYSSDNYSDDRPFYRPDPSDAKKALLIVPYSLDCNDARWHFPTNFGGADFFTYLTDAFDTLYQEGSRGQSAMMSIGLHCRICLSHIYDYSKLLNGVQPASLVDWPMSGDSSTMFKASLMSG